MAGPTVERRYTTGAPSCTDSSNTHRGERHTLPSPCPMLPENVRLGVCPECAHEIRTDDALITYQRSDETVGVFAECPACREVVTPG